MDRTLAVMTAGDRTALAQGASDAARIATTVGDNLFHAEGRADQQVGSFDIRGNAGC